MYGAGIHRAQQRMARAEQSGEAARNPYAATVYRDYVMPLSSILHEDVMRPTAGRRQAHVQLLHPLDLDAVALLSVRTALSLLLDTGRVYGLRSLAYQVGRILHCELVLAQIEHVNPDLYHTLAQDFGRRKSKDVRHRMTVFKQQAAKAGIFMDEWSIGSRDQVGLYILEQLARLNMVDIDPPPSVNGKRIAGKRPELGIRLSDEVIAVIDQIKSIVEVTSPLFGPCVEPPRDWSRMNSGGFHTEALVRVHPYLVKAPSAARGLLMDADMPVVLRAVNALQRTAWAVNGPVLDAVLSLAAHTNVGEVVTMREEGRPLPPEWLATVESTTDLDSVRAEEFISWKKRMSEWYTQRKLMGVQYGRFYSATRAAATFRDYPALHFVYFADSRGRLYPLTYGVNPQGSDLQKALIHFAVGKPLHTPEAVKWFLIHGANKFGFDKATLKAREAWHLDKQDVIMRIASDPANCTDWHEADSPLQFLAWCLEYANWRIDPHGFKSHIPISMDGSCNGLQNFSAMLRDEVGGQATNLTANPVMEDIYRRVAEVTMQLMAAAKPDDEGIIKRWLDFGIERSVVKRSVMTTPYGVTKRSAIKYVIADYLRGGRAPFEPKEYWAAASKLMEFAWPAIGAVVVKSREAMDWLSACARMIAKQYGDEREGVISWVTPSGFLASQSYYEVAEHRINTRLHGTTKIKVLTEQDSADINRHVSGLAPNFVHSMDASHLHLVTAAAGDRLIDSLAMIHDDYGTHAADAEKLYHLIREVFVEMYETHDPIADFAAAYPGCPTPPTKGTLDLREVLRSEYFFS